MRKLSLIVLCLLSLLILAACQPQSGDAEQRGIFGSKEKRGPAEGAFIGGTEAVSIVFTEGRPRADVYTGDDPFDVEVMLDNKGEAYVAKDEVKIKLTGIDPIEFGKTLQDFTINPESDLPPMVKNPADNKIIPSVPTYAKFESLMHKEDVVGNVKFPIRVNTCYPYETKVRSDICVRSNLRTLEEGVCNPNEERVVENSGAPVQVTSFSESVSSATRLAFILKINHRGNENIYSPGSQCEFERENQNKVMVDIDTGGLQGLSCIGFRAGTATSGLVELRNKEAIIRCTLDVDPQRAADFIKGINIRLSYTLGESVETSITVKPNI